MQAAEQAVLEYEILRFDPARLLGPVLGPADSLLGLEAQIIGGNFLLCEADE